MKNACLLRSDFQYFCLLWNPRRSSANALSIVISKIAFDEQKVLTAFYHVQGLREEIGALQRRIRELEAQNRALSGLLAQAANPGSPTELIQGILEAGPAAVVAALGLDPAWVPLSRPRSLNLQIPVMAATKCRRNRPLGNKSYQRYQN